MEGTLRGAVDVVEWRWPPGCEKEILSSETKGHKRGGRGSRYRWKWEIT